MQNLAILTNNSNNQLGEEINLLGQNFNTDEIINKGKDFLKVLNNDNAASQKTQLNNNYQNTNKKDFNKRENTLNKNNVENDKDYTQAVKENIQENKTDKKDKTQDTKNKEQNTNEIQKYNTETVKQEDKKTLDEIKAKNVKEFSEETAQGTNTKVLSSDEVIQEAVSKINNLIETSLDGQLNLEDVEALKNALEEIQAQINNNELVVSEETKQVLKDVLNRLLTQNPEDLAVSELQKDLKQLSQDIKAGAFKPDSQIKLEEENSNPNRALELDVQEVQTNKENKTKETLNDKNSNTINTSQSSVNVSSQVKEVQPTQEDKVDIEQQMLDDMNVQIDEVSSSQTSSNSNNQNYTTAQDEVIKLQIQNADNDSNTPVTFTFDKTIKNTNPNSQIRLEGVTKELNANDILNQIGSKFEQLKDGSSTKITMTLRPNDLGRVTIELLSTANGITTNIIAQNSQVKELLDKNIDILKQQLAQQGVNVQNVQVKTVEQNSQANLNNSYNDRNGEQGQNQNNSNSRNDGQNNQNRQHKNENFKFNHSNIIENVDFENTHNNATTSINTLRGKISYNL
ncbi:TPA: flagellar hook-length control protein FliK [Candidatus Galligastranaerophilus intestinavium]|uniref:Flagellar hook-length control protein FliK n=1 Tax=Candidatus Galligastranaerophilus intestinavium TaxID=2840836 RepID=A0A9D1FJ71_9BACT|nr:flagellar hook-length control protein FliK [Candidatus Galligastranaerophilus intestinavium]